MKRLPRLLAVMVVIMASSSFPAQTLQAQKKFELADLSKLVNLSDPQISPDGQTIVLVVGRANLKMKRFDSELVQVEIATGKQKVLTQDRPTVSQPRWSPAGDQLTFMARTGQGSDAVMQLFALSMTGGEARQITKAAKGVQHYAWGPDSQSIAYVTADEPSNKAEVERGNDVFEIGNNDMFLTSAPNPSHIWLIPVQGGEAKRLTSGTWSLPVTIPPGAPSSPLSWSPDGKTIAFVKVQSPYSGDGIARSIQLVTVNDGSIEPLTGRTKQETHPTFSPDGTQINYWSKRDGIYGNINDIWVTVPARGEGTRITGPLDRDIYRALWFPDGKSMLIGGHDDNHTSLWIQPVDGAAKKLELGSVSPAWSFWIDATVGNNGGIAFIATEPSRPSELYYMADGAAPAKRMTDFNAEVTAMTMGRTETIRWELEGYKHNGIVTYPVDYDAGKTYPLVLIVHGGPNAASVELFSRRAQLFANKGYFVFEPNYRGSDNLGSKYKTAIIKDAGAGPGRDVMAGLEKLKATGMIDPDRIGITGWSYGGYMTVWLTGHYSGWKAAMAGAAVTDWVDQYNLGDGNVYYANAVGGSPWVGDNMKSYIEQSPITNANKITCPTLVMANTLDPRVPISQSYKLYHALKDNGVTTKFMAWPLPAHNASDPVRQMELDKYWTGWMDEYLKP
jgi:dipeptidyl aminopeptidase/acylaminoacyl peptidase